jgi:RNA polymerase sigma-70 factor (ECF subfamily)
MAFAIWQKSTIVVPHRAGTRHDMGSVMPEPETFESLRPLLFSIAYRMLASVSDAEDTVQDAFLRYQHALTEGVRIESTKSYLCAMVTRLAIDHLRSARARRETYVGQWLPEPVVTDGDGGAPSDSERAESISMAFLLLLERLKPVERAVFLLHDVFGYEFSEIAAIVGKTEDNCRQLAARARKHVEAERPRFEPSLELRDDLARRFFAAVSSGNVDALMPMIAADAVVYGDGGGKVPQWSKPIIGRDRVAQLLAGVGARLGELGGSMQFHEINGQPGAMVFDREARLVNVFALDVVDGVVHTVRSVINPDKLRHLGPLADVRSLLKQRR